MSATIRAKFRPSRAVMAEAKAGKPAAPKRDARAQRLARQLALAHWIERAIEAGTVASYGDVARRLGLTQARISQIAAIALLPPAVQERILLGQGRVRVRRALREAREVEWKAYPEREYALRRPLRRSHPELELD